MSEPQKGKEPILTAILNLFTGGGGYIYIGQMAKGAIFIAGEIVFIIMTCGLMIVMASVGLGFTLLGAFAFSPLVFWGIIAAGTAWDGYRLTQRVNEGQTLDKWEFSVARK
jgi:hypothetical protein